MAGPEGSDAASLLASLEQLGLHAGRSQASAIEGLRDGVIALDRQARLGRLAIVLSRLLASRSSQREFCRAALDAIADAVAASRGFVVLFPDEDSDDGVVVARHGVAEGEPGPSRSFLQDLRTRRKTVLVSDAQSTPFSKETSVVAMGLRSVLATPLIASGRVVGAITLENISLASAFGEPQRQLLEEVSELLAPAMALGQRLDIALEDRERLARSAASGASSRGLIGETAGMQQLRTTIERVGKSDAPVLVRGESGTGKELVARALHAASRRAAKPLIAVNCAAIPETLVESELFGHERGAFTGATERKKGRFEQAHGGTLFLDEIGELSPEAQAKLLRVLQEQTFERVGGSETVRVDVRVVAATHRNIEQLVRDGQFREDLSYRLDVVPLSIPPLRERAADIPLLAERFLEDLASDAGRELAFDRDALEALSRHPFPGNVRELRNLVHRLVVLAPGPRLTLDDLPASMTGDATVSTDKDPLRRFVRHTPTTNEELKRARAQMQDVVDVYVRRLEARFLQRLLDESGGNVSEASRLAGMNRTLFHRKLKEADEG